MWMMNKFSIALIFFCVISCVVQADEITVAAAANLQFTLDDIKSAFEQKTGHKVNLVFGSSGKLTTQIRQGAPFDIFMSADEEYPQWLSKEGLTLGEPRVYAVGVLVLWTLKDIELSDDLGQLNNSIFEKIALASPKAAPYGRQAMNAMTYYKLYPAIESKLVYGESISQVNQFIVTKAADIGFTGKSVVLSPNMKDKGKWIEIDPAAYHPLNQAVVILNNATTQGRIVQDFYDFLFSVESKHIFTQYGYKLP